jgi:hypothetical protein
MPRFYVGQRVLIGGLITTKHRGREATVMHVEPSTHTRPGVTSLDKYVVRFDSGDQAEFWDIQLMAAPGTKGEGGLAIEG